MGRGLLEHADAVVLAARSMAVRFRGGGRLLTFGRGLALADARHVALEFMHPVVVGKPALPSLCLGDRLGGHGRAADVALVLDGGDGPWGVIDEARGIGMLTVLLCGAAGALGTADHELRIACEEPAVVREMRVTLFHLLWENVHVLLERGA